MRKVFRTELNGEHYWLTAVPTWYPANWESMEYCARLMIAYPAPKVQSQAVVQEAALEPTQKAKIAGKKRLYFRIWGRSKASITALWEEGRYSDFCSHDNGTAITALDVLQVVDYVVQRLGKFQNLILQHQPKLHFFDSRGHTEQEVDLYWIDADLLAPYMLRVENSDGVEPKELPLHGKTPILEKLYALERWESLDEQIAVAPRVPVKDPKSGRYVMQNALTKEVVLFPIKATRVR